MTQPTSSRPMPVIRGIYRPGQDSNDLVLWPESRKNLSEEQLAGLSEVQRAQIDKMRDLYGMVSLKRNGQEHKTFVSGWIYQDEVDNSTRIKLMADRNSGGQLLGSVHAMVTFKGQPANGSYGLRLIGTLDVPVNGQKQSLAVTGEVNPTYPERDLVLDAAQVFGFPATMVEQFGQKYDQLAVQRARKAAGTVAEPAASRTTMAP